MAAAQAGAGEIRLATYDGITHRIDNERNEDRKTVQACIQAQDLVVVEEQIETESRGLDALRKLSGCVR